MQKKALLSAKITAHFSTCKNPVLSWKFEYTFAHQSPMKRDFFTSFRLRASSFCNEIYEIFGMFFVSKKNKRKRERGQPNASELSFGMDLYSQIR